MRSLVYKILCLLLALSLVAGIAVGCHSADPIQPTTTAPTQNTTGTTTTVSNTTTHTTQTTTLPVTVPTTAATVPTTLPTVPTTAATVPTTLPPAPTTVPTQPTTAPVPPTTQTTQTTTTQPLPDPLPVEFPKLNGQYGFMFDTRTQQFLYLSHEADTRWYPASTTKMFTAYIALQYLPIDMVITVGDELDLVHSDSSVAYFKKGDILSVMDILYGLFLPSGCDAAYILAVYAGRILMDQPEATAAEAAEAFAQEMNRLGQELGMVNTHFVTVDGYHDPEHYISLQAFTIIAQLCLSNENIVKASSTHTKNLRVTNTDGTSRTLYLRSTNKLLNKNSKYYNSNVVGLKTGSHSRAGGNLVAAYKVDGGYILIGLFGYVDWDLRFSDANALFQVYQQLEALN